MKFDISFKLNKKDIEKGLNIPKEMSNELAELVGIHFGDGCMQNKYNYTYKIAYACGLSEKEYADYIIKTLKKTFNIYFKSKVYKNKGYIELYLYSKSLCEFLNKVLLVPYSPKKSLSIPHYIIKNKEYLICFLRDLFDTDGCITEQKDGKYNYKLIKICTKNLHFANQIKKSFYLLGIKSFICTKKDMYNHYGFDIVIRHKECLKFFHTIGSNNLKNIKKMGLQGFEVQR